MHLLSTLTTISLNFAYAVSILYCFTLLGHSVRLLLPGSDWTPAVAVLWDAYLGMITAAVVITLLGMAGFYQPLTFFCVLAAGPLANCRDSRTLFAPWRAVRDAIGSLSGERWAMVALIISTSIGIVSTAIPEIFYDALYYHLGLPQQYLLRGKIEWDPAVVHSAFPAYLDVLFGLCLGISGPGTAKFFNLLLFFVAWGATGAFLFQVVGDRRQALIGTVTMATVPGVVVMSTMCGIDAALIGFASMSALAIARVLQAAGALTTGLAGIVSLGGATAGFVAGSKYTGLWLIAALTPALLTSRDWKRGLRTAWLFAMIACLVAAPWYLRNAVLIGDPLYPAVKGWLGNADALWTMQRLQRDVETIGLTWTSPATLISTMIHAPARLGAGADTGVLVPLGAVALLLGALRWAELRPWAFVLALYLPIWMSLTGVMRYLYPIFPFCALGIARAVSLLLGQWPRKRLVLSLLTLFAIGPLWQSVSLLNEVYVGSDVAALLSGSLSREEYLARRLAYYPAAQWLNAHTDANARVLYLGETRLLYVDREVLFSSAYDAGHFGRLLAPGAPPLWTTLTNLGVTHILINGREIDRLRSSYDYLFLAADAERQLKTALQGCRVLFRQSGVQVCEIPSHGVS